MRNSKFYWCSCHSEGIAYCKDIEDDYGFFVYMYSMGKYHAGYRMTFKEKLRWIWNLIKTGSPWTDQVCLDLETAKAFATDLLKDVEKDEEEIRLRNADE